MLLISEATIRKLFSTTEKVKATDPRYIPGLTEKGDLII
jgi:hypothetical protein